MKGPLPEARQIGWQMYRRIGFRDHWLVNGSHIELVRFEAICATCGRPFAATATKTDWRRSRLSRRCERHKARGLPVDNLKAPLPRSKLPAWARPDKGAIKATAARRRYAKSPSQRKHRKPAYSLIFVPASPSYLE